MQRYVGGSLPRLEDERFLTGRGQYTADIAHSGELHAYILRSPHAHARICAVDAAAAGATPGVRGIFTAADLRVDRIGTLPCMAALEAVRPLVKPPRPDRKS